MSLRQRLSDAVERLLEAVSRFVAPAMPWLFLALRRTQIATLVAGMVAVLFFVVPQSREVLHGLGEPPLKSLQDFNEATAKLINFWACAFFVLTAVALGFATWYAARLLSTVEAQLATPSALGEGDGAIGLQRATTWLPRGLGIFVLSAAMGALLYASATPRLAPLPALGLVALAIFAPLLVAGGTLLRARPAQWLGFAATLLAALLLVRCTDKWRLGLVSIVCSVLPAALLWFLCQRRQVLERLGWGHRQPAHQQRGIGEVIVTLFMVVAGSVALLLLLALLPTAPVRLFGSAAAVLLFLAASVLFLTGVHIVVRRAARHVPGLTSAAIVVGVAGVAVFGDESLGDERLIAAARGAGASIAPTLTPAPAAAAAPAPAAPARPLYVNAHGGGLRAATFTAQVLARADDASCGRFGEQVAAFSGVSGGSLGIATYLIARQELVREAGWSGCTAGEPSAATPLTDVVVRALVQDHLSPAVARLLAVDAPHLPWSPTRGQALLDSWQSALIASLAEARAKRTDDEPAAFAMRLGELTGGMAHPVTVLFNATDADSGHIVWFGNRAGGQVRSRFPANAAAAPDVTVGEAVLHSARFPIVSPAGRFASQRLVDGGYADNSGTATLLRVLLDDRPHGAAASPLLLNIDGNPPDESPCMQAADNPPVLTALRALLQARSAHAALAVQQFKQAVDARALDVSLDFEQTLTAPNPGDRCEQVRRAHLAPLGWTMSYSAAKTIAASVDYSVRQICATLGEACNLQSPAPQKKP